MLSDAGAAELLGQRSFGVHHVVTYGVPASNMVSRSLGKSRWGIKT